MESIAKLIHLEEAAVAAIAYRRSALNPTDENKLPGCVCSKCGYESSESELDGSLGSILVHSLVSDSEDFSNRSFEIIPLTTEFDSSSIINFSDSDSEASLVVLPEKNLIIEEEMIDSLNNFTFIDVESNSAKIKSIDVDFDAEASSDDEDDRFVILSDIVTSKDSFKIEKTIKNKNDNNSTKHNDENKGGEEMKVTRELIINLCEDYYSEENFPCKTDDVKRITVTEATSGHIKKTAEVIKEDHKTVAKETPKKAVKVVETGKAVINDEQNSNGESVHKDTKKYLNQDFEGLSGNLSDDSNSDNWEDYSSSEEIKPAKITKVKKSKTQSYKDSISIPSIEKEDSSNKTNVRELKKKI